MFICCLQPVAYLAVRAGQCPDDSEDPLFEQLSMLLLKVTIQSLLLPERQVVFR